MFGGWGGRKKGDNNEISEAPDGGWNFDPTGFERAAKALKEIDASPNSSAALDLIKQQNDTQRMEHTRGIEEAKAQRDDLIEAFNIMMVAPKLRNMAVRRSVPASRKAISPVS